MSGSEFKKKESLSGPPHEFPLASVVSRSKCLYTFFRLARHVFVCDKITSLIDRSLPLMLSSINPIPPAALVLLRVGVTGCV